MNFRLQHCLRQTPKMAKNAVYLGLLVVIVVIVESSGETGSCECPPNSKRASCAPQKSCRPSCTNPQGTRICSDLCIANDCVCNSGYVLNSDGKCVKPSECPALCPANQQWSDCPKPLESQPSCQQPNVTQVCIDICQKPGCVCQDGYVRNSKGDCVKPTQCPGFKCPTNSTLLECAPLETCRPTCDYPPGAGICPAVCVVDDCVCDSGYVLNIDGRCLKPSDCPGPPPCPPNSTRSTCVRLRSCRPSCKNPQGTEVCPPVCGTKDCECNAGYVLNDRGDCVLPSQCNT